MKPNENELVKFDLNLVVTLCLFYLQFVEKKHNANIYMLYL